VQPRTYVRIYTDLRIQPRMNVLSGCGNYEERPDDRPARSWDLRILVSEGLIEREEKKRDKILDCLDIKNLAFISLAIVVKLSITSYLLLVIFDTSFEIFIILSRCLLPCKKCTSKNLFIYSSLASLRYGISNM